MAHLVAPAHECAAGIPLEPLQKWLDSSGCPVPAATFARLFAFTSVQTSPALSWASDPGVRSHLYAGKPALSDVLRLWRSDVHRAHPAGEELLAGRRHRLQPRRRPAAHPCVGGG